MQFLKDLTRPLRHRLSRSFDSKSAAAAWGQTSYSQFGEDMIFDYIFKWLELAQPTYLDVGASDPIVVNNTYRLYQAGSQGVLVEPNSECCAALRAARPRDVVLNCAIRTRDMPSMVDYYVMDAAMLSTIVQREAAHAQESGAWGPQKVKEVRSVSALTINEVLERHFPTGVDLIDIDIEGLDFEVLQEIDYERYRPRVVSVEIHGGHYAKKEDTGGYSYTVPKEAFIDFMKTKGYHLFVPIVLNGIFVRD
jgi:FkbM family methyltransferase